MIVLRVTRLLDRRDLSIMALKIPPSCVNMLIKLALNKIHLFTLSKCQLHLLILTAIKLGSQP